MTVPMTKLQKNINKVVESLRPKYDLAKAHPQYFIDKNDGLNVSPSDYNYPYEKPKQKDIEAIGIYIEPVRHSHTMPTLEFDWPKLTEEYKLSESNQRPVEATTIELGYEIDRLKKDAAFHQQTLINYQNETQARIDDYRNLEVDYLNSQGEVKRLQAKLEKFEGLEEYNLWLMKQYLDLKKTTVEEKKEVDRTWL